MTEPSEATKRKACECDIDELRDLLAYDPDTGVFTWKVFRGAKRPGDVAGVTRTDGYKMIGVSYRSYYAHRLAWAFAYGSWPAQEIDHIDGDPSNNAIANLRDVRPSINQLNKTKAFADNKTSGMLGVSLCPKTNRYRAQLRANGKNRSLGYYDTPEEASAAYQAAKSKILEARDD